MRKEDMLWPHNIRKREIAEVSSLVYELLIACESLVKSREDQSSDEVKRAKEAIKRAEEVASEKRGPERLTARELSKVGIEWKDMGFGIVRCKMCRKEWAINVSDPAPWFWRCPNGCNMF